MPLQKNMKMVRRFLLHGQQPNTFSKMITATTECREKIGNLCGGGMSMTCNEGESQQLTKTRKNMEMVEHQTRLILGNTFQGLREPMIADNRLEQYLLTCLAVYDLIY